MNTDLIFWWCALNDHFHEFHHVFDLVKVANIRISHDNFGSSSNVGAKDFLVANSFAIFSKDMVTLSRHRDFRHCGRQFCSNRCFYDSAALILFGPILFFWINRWLQMVKLWVFFFFDRGHTPLFTIGASVIEVHVWIGSIDARQLVFDPLAALHRQAQLVMVGLLSLILGMGLPTTANYIVVSSLMAGVVVELGAQSGLIVPLIAVHLFVFYFGIMADVTPPVGLASFAAAAVSGGDAIKTGFIAFFYSLRTVALPFVFIFNTDLLLIDVTWVQGILVFITASIAILVFTAGTMGWFLTKSRMYESVALVLVAFALFRPDFVMDRIQPPYELVEPSAFAAALGDATEGEELRLIVSGPDFDTGDIKETTLVLPVGAGSADERMTASGLFLLDEDGVTKMDEPSFGSPFSNSLGSFDFYGDEPVQIASVQAPADQMPKELIFIPALIFLMFIAFLQRARISREGVPA